MNIDKLNKEFTRAFLKNHPELLVLGVNEDNLAYRLLVYQQNMDRTRLSDGITELSDLFNKYQEGLWEIGSNK